MTTPTEPRSESYPARWWHRLDDGRLQCDLCPRKCRLHEGQRGFCFVRQREGDGLVLTTYGRSSGFCVDPIEKKPLFHFRPGSSVFSFGTAGCNLACRFCQNADISKARDMDALMDRASPDAIARTAADYGCDSVAFTYNDPVIFAEYAIDTAIACHERGIATVAVTAGYISPAPRQEFYAHMDAANVDLKGFTEEFYFRLSGVHLRPVLDTLTYLVHETSTWVEVTTLLIPGHNDATAELRAQCAWFARELGPQVPLHLTAFHPDHKMLDTPATTLDQLVRAREIALDAGLRHVYLGNLRHAEGETTWCAGCGEALIERNAYDVVAYRLTVDGRCQRCTRPVAGRFAAEAGDFGTRRIGVRISG